MHVAFVEPDGWFQGAPILRSKFSVAAQDQIRTLRRELGEETPEMNDRSRSFDLLFELVDALAEGAIVRPQLQARRSDFSASRARFRPSWHCANPSMAPM